MLAGVDVPSNWAEFVAAAPALEAVGIVQLAMGQQNWQSSGAYGVLAVALGGIEWWKEVNIYRNMDAVNSDVSKLIWDAFGAARLLSAGSKVSDWNQATNMVITGKAGGQAMGDWAQDEF